MSRIPKMSERSKTETLLGLSETEPRTAIEVAQAIGKCERLMYMNLSRLHGMGLATYTEKKHKNSNNKTCTTRCWTRVPDGCEAPLYPPQYGLDVRALDDALGGFTFHKPKPLGV